MDFSTKSLWEDPSLYSGLYSGGCGVMDPTIHDLDQQIILNNMLLFANGGMPYTFQEPALQSPSSAAFDNGWQFHENDLKGLQLPTLHAGTATAAAAAGSRMQTERYVGVEETRNSGPRRGAAEPPSLNESALGLPPAAPPHHGKRGAPMDSSLRNREVVLDARQSPRPGMIGPGGGSTQQPQPQPQLQLQPQKKRRKQQQYDERRPSGSPAAAAAATGQWEVATSPQGRDADPMLVGVSPSAKKALAEMGAHLQSVTHQQQLMVRATLTQWTGNAS